MLSAPPGAASTGLLEDRSAAYQRGDYETALPPLRPLAEQGIAEAQLIPLHGALIKNEQDVHLFERLAFMARREGR